ncbi:Abi family protein [Stutzerimonas stutzeri]|uniref:Abi family protein n=1 Tax=Stutzerimonas stutzeri TaxID=316 RepID=UPI001FAF79B1|nr:Abi family protein [Stutzerimonas stutzeri]
MITSWLKSITLLRNLCAHHSRLWNTSITSDAPKTAHSIQSEFPPQGQHGRVFSPGGGASGTDVSNWILALTGRMSLKR